MRIRWLIRRDMPEVLEIERQSFVDPWTETDFREHLRRINVIGMVADMGARNAGFLLYSLHKTRIQVLTLAVAPEWRFQRIGSDLLSCLKDKLSQQRRHAIVVDVPEGNVTACLFLRENGFRCVRSRGEEYRFVYRQFAACEESE